MTAHLSAMEVIEENKVTVKVGSVPHPMEEAHFISLIEILKDGKVVASKRLYPGGAGRLSTHEC